MRLNFNVGPFRTPPKPDASPNVRDNAPGRMAGLPVRGTTPIMSSPPPPSSVPTRPLAEREVRALPPGSAPRTSGISISSGSEAPRTAGPRADNRRLLDPAVLKREMGREPKLWSTRYNSVIRELNAYNQGLREPMSPSAAVRKQQVDKLNGALDRAITAATAHAAAHNDPAMRQLVAELRQQKLELASLAAAPPGGPPIAFKDGLAARGLGMGEQARADFAVFNEGRVTARAQFGAGQVNKTYEVRYGGGPPMILKPMHARDPEMAPVGLAIGIDRDNPRYAQRNVATAVVDRHLGFGLAPETHFARDGDRIGIAMEKAQGKSPKDLDKSQPLPMLAADRRYVDRLDPEDLDNPDVMSGLTAGGNARTADGGWARFPPVAAGIATDDARLMQDLSRLEWMDKVCGQADRHSGNYIIDRATEPPHRVLGVKAIDNDFSFGPVAGDITRRTDNGHDVGLPVLIDRETYTRLHAMQRDWEAPGGLGSELGRLLKPDEVAAARARLDALVTHSEALERGGRLVPTGEWETWRDGAGRSAHDIYMADRDASYLGRLATEKDGQRANLAGIAERITAEAAAAAPVPLPGLSLALTPPLPPPTTVAA